MDNFGVRVFNKIPKITKKNFRLSKAKFQAVVFNDSSVKFVDQLYKLQSKLANLIPASLKAKLSKLIPIKFQSTLPKTQKNKLILVSLSIGLLLVVFGLLPIIKNIKQSQQTKASGLQISNVYPAIGNNQGGDKLLIEGKGFNIPGVEFTKVSAGNYHTCAIATNGKTYCWGFNQYGYLGNGTTNDRLIPTEVINSATLNFTQIAIGFYHTCAIATNGKTYCWGFNNQSQLGDNTTTQRNIPTEVTNSATLNFTQITAGIYHTCAISSNNKTYCWGYNIYGQLGDNSTTNRPIPTEVSNSATLNFTQITAGSYHTCAIAANNRTYCWGRNDYGQLGDNSTTQRRIPREVTNSATLNFTQIVAGQNHTCAIAANNRTYCWGRNDYGQLGDNSTTQRRIPREVANSANLNFTKLSVGFNAFHTCAIAANNRTYCWGQNGNGQLGDNTTTRRNIPTEVTNSSTLNFKQVSAGSTYTCAIATNNKTYCWGDNGFGQLGDNSKTQRLSPVAVVSPVIVGITQISAGGGSCAISSNNKTYCWGYNGDGQLGDNSTIDRFIPTEVTNSATLNFTQIVAGQAHTCAIAANNRTYCWGQNGNGQLGDNTTTRRHVPTEVTNSAVLNFKQIAIGTLHTCAIATNNRTYCWGDNSYGQLGDNTTTRRNIPTEVTNSSSLNFTKIYANHYHTCAIAANNRTYCWGDNSYGQLGDNTTTRRNIPTEVTNSSSLNFSQISVGSLHTCAIAANNRTYCWGWNNYGQLGNGATNNRHIPTEVTNSSNLAFTHIDSGHAQVCAISSNGKTYCWGLNSNGQIGDGTTNNRYVPTEVANSVNFKFVRFDVGFHHTCAIAANNRIYCWGNNSHGQLGIGTASGHYTTPVEIDPTNLLVSATSNLTATIAGINVNVNRISDTKLELITPPKPAHLPNESKVDITISNSPTETVTLSNAYTYYTPEAPVIESVLNNLAHIYGGQLVTIKGKNFNPMRWRRVALGDSFSCAIASNNKTYCWGKNNNGQLGDNSVVNRPVLTEVTNSATLNFTQISAGGSHTCAIAADNKTYCWGKNNNGQLGDNTTTRRHVPTEVTNSTTLNFTQIVAGQNHTCAIAANNRTYCWGRNEYGQLGDNTTTNRSVPTEVTNSATLNFTQISAGYEHTCAIAANNKTYCWGYNGSGKLGDNSTTNRSIPTEVTNSATLNFTQIVAGQAHTCAIAANNRTYCWGDNSYGQLGDNSTTSRSIPTEVTNSATLNFTQISAGYEHTCAIAANNRTYCWGRGAYGQLGNDSNNPLHVPTEVTNSATLNFTQIVAGQNHTCAIAANNRTYCWGSNYENQLAHNGIESRGLPEELKSNLVVQIGNSFTQEGLYEELNDKFDQEIKPITPLNETPGSYNVMIKNLTLNLDSNVVTGGLQYVKPAPTISGNNPNQTKANKPTDVAVTGNNLTNLKNGQFKEVSIGSNAICAIATDNKTYCWGHNRYGQLGNNTTSLSNVPVEVTNSGDLNFTKISTAGSHTCAISTNGRTYCWGYNVDAALGDGTGINRHVPTEVVNSANLNFKQISAGVHSTCAIAANNRTYCWGYRYKSFFSSTYQVDLIPTEVANSDTLNFTQISAGDDHVCAIAANGKTYCWGYGTDGQLGNNVFAGSNTPTEVANSASLNFTQITAGHDFTCAIAANNKTYCWGRNKYGQLGDNTTTNRSVPTEVTNSATLNFTQISAGDDHVCAIAANGKTYCWGNSFGGKIGNGFINAFYYTPTEVTGFSGLSRVDAGRKTACILSNNNNNLYCWGNSRLGNNQSYGRYSPSLVLTKQPPAVKFGNLPATDVVIRVPTNRFVTNSLTAKTPSHDPAKVLVSVTNPDGQATSTTMTDANSHIFYNKAKAPTDLSATPIAPVNTIKLDFKSPSDNGLDNQISQGNNFSPVTDYQIEYCLANVTNDACLDPTNTNPNVTNPTNWLVYPHTAVTSTSNQPLTINIANLTHASNYLFRVAAINQAGVGNYSNLVYNLPSYVSLNLSTDSSQINLTPSYSNTFSTSKLSTYINTNLPTGYSLKFSTNGNQNQLIHTTTPTSLFNPVNSTFQAPTTLATNTWGFRIPNTTTNQQQNTIPYTQFSPDNTDVTNQSSHNLKYSPIPTIGQPLTICQYNQPTNNKQLDLIFGVNASYDQLSGSYRQTARFELVGN